MVIEYRVLSNRSGIISIDSNFASHHVTTPTISPLPSPHQLTPQLPCFPKLPHHLDFLRPVAYHHPHTGACGRTDGLPLGVVANNEDGMATKRGASGVSETQSVTADRAARLYKLLRLLAAGPQKRDTLIKRLRLDIRGFYRDLELLHRSGIAIELAKHRYTLEEEADEAIARLPFPDPRLTLGEVQQLAKGRTRVHRKLQQLVAQIVK